jgi:hypothetical protein
VNSHQAAMKLPLILVLSLVLTVTGSAAEEPMTKASFLAAIRAAIESKDIAGLHGLTWEQGMSEDDKEFNERRLHDMVEDNDIESMDFQTVSSWFMAFPVEYGRRSEPTHPPDGMLRIFEKPGPDDDGRSRTVKVPYAVIDGRYYMVAIRSTDLGWKGPPDQPLTVEVMADGKDVDKVRIDVRYNACGLNLEADHLMDPYEAGYCFVGQYIEDVTVTSDSDSVKVSFWLIDGKGEFYDSAELMGKGKIHYRRGDKTVKPLTDSR